MSDNSSTLKSYVDRATGAAQSTFGSLTGNTADEVSFATSEHISRSHRLPLQAQLKVSIIEQRSLGLHTIECGGSSDTNYSE